MRIGLIVVVLLVCGLVAATGNIYLDKEGFADRCSAETVTAFVGESAAISSENLMEPHVVCNDLVESCCTKEQFTWGYSKFNTVLRQPVINGLRDFQEIQKLLYKLDFKTLNTYLSSVKKRNAECLHFTDDMTPSLVSLKANKSRLYDQFADMSNRVLQMYSGVLCATCNSDSKPMLVVGETDVDHNPFLTIKLKQQVCQRHIENQVSAAELALSLRPLFMWSKTVKCANNNHSDHLYKRLNVALIESKLSFLRRCLVKENVKDLACLSYCENNAEVVTYYDEYSLFANLHDAYKTLYTHTTGKPAKPSEKIKALDGGAQMIANELNADKYELYINYNSAGFDFENIKLQFSGDKAIDTTTDLMKPEFYKHTSIILCTAVVLFAFVLW